MNESTKQHLLLLGASCMVHLFIVLALFFFACDNTLHKKFIVLGAHSQKPTKSLYKPMHGIVPFVGSKQKAGTGNKKTAGKQKKAKAGVAKKTAIKNKQKPKINEKALPEIKEPSKKKSKKKQVPIIEKKIAPTVQKPKKSMLKKQEEVVKPIKPTVKEEVKKEEEPVKEESNPQEEDIEQEQEEVIGEDDDDDEAEVLEFTSDDSNDYDPVLYEYHRAIQIEVARVWHPPVGVEKGTEAVGCFTISKQGEVEAFEFISKSKIVIYDLSIKLAAKKCTFDKKLWGKKFTIAFRQ